MAETVDVFRKTKAMVTDLDTLLLVERASLVEYGIAVGHF